MILFVYCRERGREGKRETSVYGRNIDLLPTGNLAHNPGVCPEWEMNPQSFSLQASTQSTEPHPPGHSWHVGMPNEIFNF